MCAIRKIHLPVAGLAALVQQASAEGYTFLECLEADWASGSIRFDGPGEALYGAFDDDDLVAVGALSCDPFLGDPGVGRLRRIYVRAGWRRRGIGARLVAAMLADARQSFRLVRLRADNASAARLYETFGFQPFADTHATHWLPLDQDAGAEP